MITEAEFINKATEQGFSQEEALDFYVQKTQKSVEPINIDEETFVTKALESNPEYSEEEIRGVYKQRVNTIQSREGDTQILKKPQVINSDELFYGSVDSTTLGTQVTTPISEDTEQLADILASRGMSYSSAISTAEEAQNGHPFYAYAKERDLVSNYKEFLSPHTSALELLSLVDEGKKKELAALNQDVAKNVIASAQTFGVELAYENGKYYTLSKDGQSRVDVTPGMLQELYQEKNEIIGGVSGALLGGRLGARFGWPGVIGGSVVGGSSGSAVGTFIDHTVKSMELQEELQAKFGLEKALGAAKLSAVVDLATLGTFKLGQAGWRSTRYLWDHISTGNRPGAYDALKHHFNIHDEAELERIVSKFEEINSLKLPGTLADKSLIAIPVTQAGGEGLMTTVAKLDPHTAASVVNEARKRSETLIAAAENITKPGSGRRVMEAVREYENETKLFFNSVKAEFTSGEIPPSLVQDIGPTLDEALSKVRSKLSIDNVQHLDYLRELAPELRSSMQKLSSEGGNPAELLDLRQQVTRLKYSKAITDTEALNSLDTVIAQLDQATKTVAEHNLGVEGAKAWLDNWSGKHGALQQYSEMIQYKRNKLYQSIIKEGETNESIAKTLVRLGDTVDDAYFGANSYKQFRKNLSISAARDIEGDITRLLVDKHSINKAGEVRATNFLTLSRELKEYDMLTPEAQRIQIVAERLSEVYRNDVKLLKGSNFVNLEQFQSYLTTNPITRAKFWMSSKFFNWVQQVSGGGSSDSRALVNIVAKFLEDPVNTRTTEQLLKQVGDDQAMQTAIKNFQATIAKEGIENYSKPVAKVFKDKKGKFYLKPGKNRTAAELSIPMHRMIDEQQAKNNFGLADLTASSLTKVHKAALLDDGFQAIVLNDGQILNLL